MSELTLKLQLQPGIEQGQLQAVVSQIKSGLGDLGKQMTVISPEGLLNPLKAASGQAASAGHSAGQGFSNAFTSKLGGIKNQVGGMFGQLGGMLRGGSLGGAIDGIGGSIMGVIGKMGPWGAAIGGVAAAFGALYAKGKAIDDIRDSFELMFAGKGITGNAVIAEVDRVMSSVSKLNYALDFPKEQLRDLFKVAITAGKSGEAAEVFVKQGLAVEKMTNGFVGAQEVMKLLNKGMANPENEAIFNRLAAKAPELAFGLKSAANETDRMNFLMSKTGPVLDKLVEQAKSPETAFERLGKAWDSIFGAAAGETFNLGNELMAPIGDFADWVMDNMKTIKAVIKETFKWIGVVWELVLANFKIGFEAIKFFFMSIYGTAEFIFNKLSGIITPVVNAFKSLFGLEKQGTGFFTKISDSIKQAGSVTNWLRGQIAGFTSMFATFINLISESWTRLKSLDIGGAAGVWANAGKRLSEGFTKGYNEKVDALKEEQAKKELDAEKDKQHKIDMGKKKAGDKSADNEKDRLAKLNGELLKMQNDLEEQKFLLSNKGIDDNIKKELAALEFKNKKEIDAIVEQEKKIQDEKKKRGTSAAEIKVMENELKVLDEKRKIAEQIFQADKQGILDKGLEEERVKRDEQNKFEYDQNKRLQDDLFKLMEDRQKKEEDLLNKKIELQKKFFDILNNLFQQQATKEIDGIRDKELKKLDAEFGKTQDVDPKEAAYNRKKEEIEKQHQSRITAIQATAQGSQFELQRKKDLELLEQKKKASAEQLAAMEKQNSIDPKAYFEQLKIFEDLNVQVAEKSNIIQQTLGGMQDNIAEMTGNLFSGNVDGMKQSASKLFSNIAGVIKRMLATAVAEQVLSTLSVSGPYAWLATPIIYGAIYAALSALVDPILNSITSFSTGGRIDEPTLALIGDASSSRAGSNTEWIFRDDQLKLFIKLAVAEALTGYQKETVAPAYLSLSMTPLIEGFKELRKVVADYTLSKQQMSSLSQSLDKFNSAAELFRIYEPESIMDGAELRSFMQETLAHQGRLETKLDLILDAIGQNKDVYLDGRKVTDEVNRTNFATSSRIRSPFN